MKTTFTNSYFNKMFRSLLAFCVFLLMSIHTYAQVTATEPFEDEGPSVQTIFGNPQLKVFSQSGISFTLSGRLRVGGNASTAFGANNSFYYLDSFDGPQTPTVTGNMGSITINNAATAFKINSFAGYTASNATGSTKAAGVITFTGTKVDGSTATANVTITPTNVGSFVQNGLTFTGTALDGIYLTSLAISLPTGIQYILLDDINFTTQAVVSNQFSINDVSQNEGNSSTSNFTFTVTRSNNTAASSVQVQSSNGTATSGSDYTAFPLTTVNFTAGGALTQTVNVVVNGDVTVEPNEIFTMTLSNPTGGVLLDATGTGTIVDDDAINEPFDDETELTSTFSQSGNNFQTTGKLIVRRNGGNFGAGGTQGYAASSEPYAVGSQGSLQMTSAGKSFNVISVDLWAAAVSGSAPSFTFTPTNCTITFTGTKADGSGTVTHTAAITPSGTNVHSTVLFAGSPFDGVQLSAISFSTPTGIQYLGIDNFKYGTATLTNTQLSIDDVSVIEGTGGGSTTATFTVTRTNNTTAFTVNLASSDGTATAGTDYTAFPSTTLTFTSGGALTQTVNVTVLKDATIEPNETFNMTLSGATNGTVYLKQTGIGTILNDDSVIETFEDETNLATTFSESGASFSTSGGYRVRQASTFGSGSSTFYLSSTNNAVGNQGTFSLTTANKAFKLNGLDAWVGTTETSHSSGSVTFTGTLFGGGTVSTTKTITATSATGAGYQLNVTFTGTPLDNVLLTAIQVTTAGALTECDIDNFNYTVVNTLPIIEVVDASNVAITNGGVAGTANNTDFGLRCLTGATQSKTYTIKNSGNTNLTLSGSPLAVLGGTDASQFSITTQPTSPIAPGSSITFTVLFDPNIVGAKNATITLTSNDATNTPYVINIKGIGGAEPTATIGTISSICAGATSFNIPFSNLTANPTAFSVSGTGITTIINNTNLTSPAVVTLSSPAVFGTNPSFTFSLLNGNGCVSSPNYTGSVTVLAAPVASPGSNSPVCVGSTLNLTSTTATSYLWTGPNSFSSTMQNPNVSNVTIVAGGTYTLSVTNANCTSTATTSVTVTALPVATASSNSPTCIGNNLNLIGGGVGTYAWAGPDSFTSTAQSPTITNATALATGTYTITVTNASNCTSTATVAVTMNATPTATASNSTPTICAGSSISLMGGGVGTYLWTGPNGYTSTDQSPTIPNATIAASGTYTITVTGAGNCTSIATTSVTVNALPTASASSNSPICAGTTLNLTGGAAGNTYAWAGPNSFTSTDQNPSIINATTLATGTYTITVTNASSCTSTSTVAVTVNAVPTATASSNSPVCAGSSISLTGGGVGTYLWTGPSGYSSTAQSPTITNATASSTGTYTITVTGAGSCVSTATVAVTVNTQPTITSVANLLDNNTVGQCGKIIPYNSSTTGIPTPTVSYVITGATSASGSGNGGGTFFNVGTSTIVLTATNSCGVGTYSFTITVNDRARITPTASSNSPVCVGSPLNLVGNPGGNTYLWAGPNSFSSTAQSPNVTNSTSLLVGIYTVAITNVSNCTSTATTSVTVNTVPTATASSNSPVCVGNSISLTGGGDGSYLWTGPNGYSSTAQSPTIASATVSATGTYTITVTNSSSCTSTATTSVTVNGASTANATPSTQTICSGGAITTIAITGTGTSYTWVRDNTANVTGISASGSGNIMGSLTNTTEAPITVTFTITPVGACNGTPITATVVVNPIPTVIASTPSQTICSGQNITGITFNNPPPSAQPIPDPSTDIAPTAPKPQQGIGLSSFVAGTVFNWTRDNTATAVGGILPSGTGNISGSLTNTTTSPITVTFTVTPSYTNAGTTCTGTPITVTVLVNPNPIAVLSDAGTSFCQSGSTTLSANADPNYTYAWERSLSGIANPNSFTSFGGTAQMQAITTSGVYRVVVTNQYNCSVRDTTAIRFADFSFSGSLDVGDATQTGRMNRFGVVSTCVAQKNYPGDFTTSGTRLYDSYTITNPRNVPVCATIGIRSGCGTNIFCAAYSGSYNPTLLSTNYLADPGSSFPLTAFYEVTIPANGTIVVVVHELNPGTGCANYNLTVELPRDVAGITVTPNTSICAGTPVSLQASTANSYAWTGGGTFSTQTINPSPTVTTTYNVMLGYGNGTCSATTSAQVVVNVVTPSTQTICSGGAITTIALTGAGTNYTWTRDNTANVTGIAANGTGDISGSLTNTTDAPVTVTFTLGTCNGTPITATVVVNPIPTVIASTPSQMICSGSNITGITFNNPPPSAQPIPDPSTDIASTAPKPQQGIGLSSFVAGTVFNWTRDNTATVIGGILPSGSGNISGSLTNTTTSPITVTFTVTPSYTNAGTTCTGTPITVTVTVNPNPPAPTITDAGTAFCSGSSTTLTSSADPTYTSYAWERSLTGIANPNSFTAFGGTAQTQAVTTSGVYRVVVTNQYNCSARDTTAVKFGDFVFNGSLATGDAQQTGRMNRFAQVSTCAAPKSYPGDFTTTGTRLYDSYTVTNPTSAPVCATIGLTSGCGTNIFSVAYLGSYTPTSLGTNYLADPGSSFPLTAFYEATIPANGTIVIVVHEVNPGSGCSNYNLRVDVPGATVAPTASSNSPICAGNTLNLTGTGTGTYAWSGPNSFTSSAQNPTIPNATVSATGTYTISVTNTNGCVFNATTAVIVNALPTATANSNSPICAGTTLNLIGGGIGTYSWTSSNGFTSTAQSPTIANATVSATGTYTITVTNVSGCTSTASVVVTVNALPTATASSNSPICAGTTLNLTGGGVGSYSWTGVNSFTSTDQNPSIPNASILASGTYRILVTNINGCTSTATTSVMVNALPTATANSNSPICSGVTLNLTGGGIGTYSWAGPSSYTSTAQSPSIPSATASMSGIYTILVTNVSGCTSTATTSVTVNPVVTIPTPQANTQIIFGGSITLTATGCSGVNDVLKWYNSLDNSLAVMPVSPTATTNYYAKCETTLNGITCISGNSTDVTVTVLSPNPPVATGATNCLGTPTTLTATGCSGSVGTFVLKWYQNADDALVTMPVSPTTNTDYYARCEQTFNSVTAVSAKSNVVTLIILNPPTPVSTGGTIYNGQSISLTATGCTGTLGTFTLKWYQTADNALVTMPVSPTVTTQYYARCEQTANSVTCASVKSNDVSVTVVNRIFVDITKIAAPIQNGNSWATAYGNLQTGLAAATAGVEVWVAKGTYKPTNTTTRTIYFNIPNSVLVYGGFAGTEDNLIDRNFRTNVSILSGDIGTPNLETDNSYHVVVMNGSSTTTVLDGFTIMGGNANFDPNQTFNVPLTAPTTATIETGGGILVQNAGMPTIANCTIIQNAAVTGGGLYAGDASMPTIIFCKVMANQAGFGSGMYFQDGSNGKVNNTLIAGNRGIGGVYNNVASPIFTNVTFAGNGGYSGGIFNSKSQPVVKNSIIWGNSTPFNDTQSIITYSTIQGGYAGVGNLSMDPKFVSQTPEGLSPILSGDYHVQASSLTIDRGDNGAISPTEKDLDGNLRRFAGGRVDMGPYEFQGTATATLIISVQTGNWESNSTWDIGRVPQLGDYVIIDSNHIVTLNGTGIAKNLEYRGTGQLKFNTATSKLEIGF